VQAVHVFLVARPAGYADAIGVTRLFTAVILASATIAPGAAGQVQGRRDKAPSATASRTSTSYELDLVRGGQTRTERGVATEVFVMQEGRWLNTAWQLAHD
jgi:hypothetical protein